MKTFKIGEFAKYLGVTPDFLKHHEASGLLEPQEGENGYRTYSFRSASNVIQCLRLRNLGVTTREISELMKNSTAANTMEMFVDRKDDILKNIAFEQEIVKQIEEYEMYMNEVNSSIMWKVEIVEPYLYFINGRDFDFVKMDDEDYELIKELNDYMPLVEGFGQYKRKENPETGEMVFTCDFGLVVKKSVADKLGFGANERLKEIPRQKCLVYKALRDGVNNNFGADQYRAEITKIITDNGFEVLCDGWTRIHYESNLKKENFSFTTIYVPIK